MIENKLLAESVLESIVGKHGVSPEARKCMAARLSELLNAIDGDENLHCEKVCEEQKICLEAAEGKGNKEVEVKT